MAANKAITPHDLLCCEDESEWLYAGTRDELIAAGLAQAGDFPGDPGGPIYSRMIKRGNRRAYISIHSRVASPITFWLKVYKTPISDERERNKQLAAAREAKYQAERAKYREDADASMLRGTVSKEHQYDPETLSYHCERLLMATHHVVINMMSGEGHAESARYDKETVDKVAAALDHARQLLQSSVPQRPRAVVRQEKLVAVAKRDSEFQAFIASTLAPPKPQGEQEGLTLSKFDTIMVLTKLQIESRSATKPNRSPREGAP
jgi:hypothetical protein